MRTEGKKLEGRDKTGANAEEEKRGRKWQVSELSSAEYARILPVFGSSAPCEI